VVADGGRRSAARAPGDRVAGERPPLSGAVRVIDRADRR
jgi:hypothetical protein